MIIDSTRNALGGKDAYRRIGAFHTSGDIFKRDGTRGRFEVSILKENWARVDYLFEDEQITFSRHGRRGWKMHRADSLEEMVRLKRKDLAIESYLHLYENNLFDYDLRGLDVYYEGELTSVMSSAYIIRLAGFSYGEEVYYIDQTTFRPFIKQVYLTKGRGDTVITYNIDEYMQVGKVWLPKRVSIEGEGNLFVLDFKSYNLQATPDEGIFIY